ncbi:efflux RND transporter permease subunit, partial [Sphingomonas sp. PsM26]|nr:efflux RND transporter permease subunit [Sphingomonas sp. PsM26]
PMPVAKLSDLAKIELVGKVKSISRTNGEDAISIQVTKTQDANTVTVVNAVKQFVEENETRFPDLLIDITLDQGEP